MKRRTGAGGRAGGLDAIEGEIDNAETRLAAIISRLKQPRLADEPDSDGCRAATVEFARRTIAVRRLREEMFGSQFFADPAWDILLDLYIHGEKGVPVSISSLCMAAAVPPTTAQRWIKLLADAGVLVRGNDPCDARRVFITLAREAHESMHVCLRRTMAELAGCIAEKKAAPLSSFH